MWWWGVYSYLTGLTSTLTRIPSLQHAVQVSVGANHCLLLLATGAVYALGGNTYNQLGSNTYNQAAPLPVTDSLVHQPTLVAGLDSVSISTVHAGENVSFVYSESGDLFTWGRGDHGCLATGTTDHRRTGLARVEALCSTKICSLGGSTGLVAVATNAETGDEEFYTWGRTCVYISDDAPGELLEPRRFELPST